MSFVFVVDKDRKPLGSGPSGSCAVSPHIGACRVLRRYPFVLIMKEVKPDAQPAPLRLKIDPGSKTTGVAVVNDATGDVVWAAELTHRGSQVKEHLDQRRECRRSRRQHHTRYRQPRFNNRTRLKGWLPPSLVSRVQNILTWVERVRRYAPITALSFELVRFDTQLMEQPDITGLEYQNGTLAGWEIREYLLIKWNYRCAYCHQETDRWEVDHIIPRSRSGTSNRITNLALSCHACNQQKGDRTASEYGHPEVQTEAGKPLKDAAAVNSTRWALYERLQATGLPIETGSGGLTKYNRSMRGIPKTHWLDAANVGTSTPTEVQWQNHHPLPYHRTGLAETPNVPGRQVRLSPYQGQAIESCVWVQDRRYGQSGRAQWQTAGDSCGQSGHQSEWQFHDHHEATCRPGCALSVLHHPSTQ